MHYLLQYKALIWILITACGLAGANIGLGQWILPQVGAPSLHGLSFVMLVMGYFLACLGVLKVLDLGAFVQSFRTYDYFSRKLRWYGPAFPFLELLVALCVISGTWSGWLGLVAIAMGLSGSLSIYTRLKGDAGADRSAAKLTCGCAGGHVKLPLGSMSIVENVMMIVMGCMLLLG